MEKNKRLNPRNIFEKPIYRSILHILMTYKNRKVKFSHLKYALVNKQYEQIKDKMEKFFLHSTDDNAIKSLTKQYEKGKFNHEAFLILMDVLKSNFLKSLIDGYMSNKDKLGSESSLRDKLYELIELGLIEKIPDKKGHSYYKLTNLGFIRYSRWNVHSVIDKFISDDELEEFLKIIMTYIFKKKKSVSLR